MAILKFKDNDGTWKAVYKDLMFAIKNRLRCDKNLSDVTDVAASRASLGLIGDNNHTHYHDDRYLGKISEAKNAFLDMLEKFKERVNQELAKMLAEIEKLKLLIQSFERVLEDAGLNMLKRKKKYEVGDIAYSKNIPTWVRLECVQAGETGDKDPVEFEGIKKAGGLIKDGSVIWIVDDMRDGTPTGSVRGSLFVPSGYLKADGKTIKRDEYPRLAALADKYRLWTKDIASNSGMFGEGDGETTMVLPNWTDRMTQFSFEATGSSVEAGLPNITGHVDTDGAGCLTSDEVKKGDALSHDNFTAGTSFWGAVASLYRGVNIDASRCSPIYGASNTVQPAAIRLIPVIKY